MPDDPITTPESATQTGQTGETTTQTRDADAEVQKAYDKLRAAERQRDELKKQADEAAELKKRLEALENEKLSDADKLKKRADELASQVAEFQRKESEAERVRTETVRDYEVRLAAMRPEMDRDGNVTRAAFRDPEDAIRFLDLAEVEYDDNGRPENIGKLLAKLAKDKPYLLDDGNLLATGKAAIRATPKTAAPASYGERLAAEIAAQKARGGYAR